MITIDAKGKTLGRVASAAAKILIGKHLSSYARNKISGEAVEVTNAAEIAIDPKKLENKKYAYFSGYPGGLRFESMEKLIEKKGRKEVLRRAVWGMLPKNKLRAIMIKRLKVID